MSSQSDLIGANKRSKRRMNAKAGLATKPNDRFAEIMRDAENKKSYYGSPDRLANQLSKDRNEQIVSDSIEVAKKELEAEIEEQIRQVMLAENEPSA